MREGHLARKTTMEDARRNMLKKLFALVGGAAFVATPEAAPQPRQASDRELAAQACAGELARLAIDADDGDPASALCALGALAGYACQASLRARCRAAGLPETAWLVAVTTLGGRQYFFGDALNRLLLEEPLSLWRLAGEAARMAGCRSLPDPGPVFREAAASAGTRAFGVLPASLRPQPRHMPEHYLRRLWPAALARLERDCPDPAWWPVSAAIAAQGVVASAPAAEDACAALSLLLAAAIPMSKLDLAAPAHPPGSPAIH